MRTVAHILAIALALAWLLLLALTATYDGVMMHDTLKRLSQKIETLR